MTKVVRYRQFNCLIDSCQALPHCLATATTARIKMEAGTLSIIRMETRLELSRLIVNNITEILENLLWR
jgi:hypothetical protein